MAKKLAFDKVLFTIVVLLVFFGLVMVYSASDALARDRTPNHFLVKQSAAAGLGLVLMGWLMHVDYRRLRSPAVVYSVLFGVVALLVGVLFSPQLNATRRWFFIGGVSVQPSELAKLALVSFLAYQIEKKEERVSELAFLLPAGFFTALIAALILLEPDMGTAVLLGATFFLMVFLAGLSWRYILAALAVERADHCLPRGGLHAGRRRRTGTRADRIVQPGGRRGRRVVSAAPPVGGCHPAPQRDRETVDLGG